MRDNLTIYIFYKTFQIGVIFNVSHTLIVNMVIKYCFIVAYI